MANPKTKTVVTVDPDQKDPAKSVTRSEVEDRQLPGREGADVSDVEQRQSQWLERNRAVQKRISRMQRQFDQRIGNMEADLQRTRRENEELKRTRIDRGTDIAASDAEHERDMNALQQKYEELLDAGKSKEAAEVNRQMIRKEAAFMNAKTNAALGRAREEKEPPPAQQQQKPSAEGRKFTSQQDWWDDEEFRAERGAANAIFAGMVQDEDADPEDAETYVELSRRLLAKFPKLDIQGVDLKKSKDEEELDEEDVDVPRRETRRAPVQSLQDRGSNGGGRRRGTVLTEKDFSTMRAMGMDPTNDKHLREFARSRQELAAQG